MAEVCFVTIFNYHTIVYCNYTCTLEITSWIQEICPACLLCKFSHSKFEGQLVTLSDILLKVHLMAVVTGAVLCLSFHQNYVEGWTMMSVDRQLSI